MPARKESFSKPAFGFLSVIPFDSGSVSAESTSFLCLVPSLSISCVTDGGITDVHRTT